MSKKCDVLIVGCGVAGLNTALSLPENLNIIMLAKKSNTDSNSSLAQGGVAAVLDLENDSYDLHIKDTMIAGQQANDIDDDLNDNDTVNKRRGASRSARI